MSVQTVQEEKHELRQQAYQALMNIGAQIPAEKIILNDLRADNEFDLAASQKCVVGWAWEGPEGYVNNPDWYGEGYDLAHAKCSQCCRYSYRLLDLQAINKSGDYISLPTISFLKEVIKFTDHFKVAHK